MLPLLAKYILFLIEKLLFLESFLGREKATKLLQTVIKIIRSDRSVYCKKWGFCFLPYPKRNAVYAFCFHETSKHWYLPTMGPNLSSVIYRMSTFRKSDKRDRVTKFRNFAKLISSSVDNFNMWELCGFHTMYPHTSLHYSV